MSIVSEIERIKSNIANAYTACEEKGATMPSVLNSANLFDCIASITGGVVAKQLIYMGKTTALAKARQNAPSGNVGEYGLLCIGGNSSSTMYANIDAYKADLTKPTNPSLSYSAHTVQVANTTDYLLVSGGWNGSKQVSTVNSFNATLTRSIPKALTNIVRYQFGVGIGGKAIFAGGWTGSMYLNTVDVYDNNLVKTTATALSVAKAQGCGGAIGDYALIAGGRDDNTYYDTVETYNSTLVKGTATALTVGRIQSESAKAGNKLLIAGGRISDTALTDIVDIYTETLVKETPTTLSLPKHYFGSAEIDKHAFFCCGETGIGTSSYDNTVDMFDTHLVRTTTNTSIKKSMTKPVAVGKCLLSGGGYNGSSSQSAVEVFSLV